MISSPDAESEPQGIWRPRQQIWDARALFAPVSRGDVPLSTTELEALRDYFWYDLCAEWDAIHLHQEFHRGHRSWSPEFLRFEQAWYEDELNHAEGFLAIWGILYGESREQTVARLSQRQPDFGPVARFIESEFEVCVLFAYDELATMRAYRLDLDLYRNLGHPAFQTWLRHLMRDETYHHKNAFDLAMLLHSERLGEVDDLIRGFQEHDAKNPSYRATFIFDHEWGHVDGSFFDETATLLRASFLRAASAASRM